MLEKHIEGPASQYAKLRRWFVTKIEKATPNGFPDRFYARKTEKCPCCGRSGDVLLIEYKAPGKKPTEQQLLRHQQLRDAGVRVEVVDDLERAKELLR